MNEFRVVRVADVRMPQGRDWMVVQSAEGFVVAFLAATVRLTARMLLAIRAAVAALPPVVARPLAV